MRSLCDTIYCTTYISAMDTLTIRIPEKEADILVSYCVRHNRTRTDVIREFIRSLEGK
jgi:hypothetical protein